MTKPQLNMATGVREFARSIPKSLAVLDGDREVSFAELDNRSNRIANSMLKAGLRPGDPVAVLSGNRFEYFEIATGLAKAGLPMVPLNPHNTVADNDYILGHSDAKALILDSELAESVTGLIQGLTCTASFGGHLGEDYESLLADSEDNDPNIYVNEDDIFCITYTSGTTGKPKGVMLTHRGRALTNYAAALDFGLGPGSKTIAVAPMYHGAGFAFAYAGPMLGGTTSVLRAWDPEILLSKLETDRINTAFLVPTHAQQIRRLIETPLAKYDLSQLHTLYFNAAALPVALKEWVIDAFPGVGIHEVYGSTECGIVTNLRPVDSLRKAGSVGHPWFMTEVRLVDDDMVQVGPNEPGELYARSPFLMKGYLGDEAATKSATDAEGFVTVGDVAVADEEGFISIVDRKKDMIISGGVNIFPREIEEVISKFENVHEVAVIGLPDEIYGERVAGFVVARTEQAIDLDSLNRHARANLSSQKVPREWHVLASLPRNAAGKVVKGSIRDNYLAAN
ncbi:MAG: AMP-binding protein [Actinobacteria bacterium]|nr:AMP-binding protein [Actinomycetota bacterium]